MVSVFFFFSMVFSVHSRAFHMKFLFFSQVHSVDLTLLDAAHKKQGEMQALKARALTQAQKLHVTGECEKESGVTEMGSELVT